MAGSIAIAVGATTYSLPVNGTNAQIAAALTRYARSLGISTSGTNEQNMDAILKHIRDDISRRSKAVQLADLAAAQAAANQATVDADNALQHKGPRQSSRPCLCFY